MPAEEGVADSKSTTSSPAGTVRKYKRVSSREGVVNSESRLLPCEGVSASEN